MSKHPRLQDGTEPEDSRLARWSERKARSRLDKDVPADEKTEDDGGEELPQKGDEDMPPVETLDEHSDVSEFFSPCVSDRLRTAALRKFFHSPVFNIVDGLDDYDDDFTSFKALGDIVTADMRHRMEMEAKAREEERAGQVSAAEEGEDAREPVNTPPEQEQDEAVSGTEAEVSDPEEERDKSEKMVRDDTQLSGDDVA